MILQQIKETVLAVLFVALVGGLVLAVIGSIVYSAREYGQELDACAAAGGTMVRIASGTRKCIRTEVIDTAAIMERRP